MNWKKLLLPHNFSSAAERLERVEAALADLASRLSDLDMSMAALQQQVSADLAEDQKQTAAFEAQQTALSTLATGLSSVQAQQSAQALADKERDDRWEDRFGDQQESMGAIHAQLVEVRKGVDGMQAAAQEANLRRRLELVPVRVGDLMRGFQSAVSRANAATRAGEGDGQDIAQMAIKDLEVSLEAPIIEGGHAEDPTLMLPNIKSVDRETASITIKFSVVTLPAMQKG